MSTWKQGDSVPDMLRKILAAVAGVSGGGSTTLFTSIDNGIATLHTDVTAVLAALAAGTRMGGYSESILSAAAVDTAVYTAGDSVGGLRTLDLGRVAAGGVVLESITVLDDAVQDSDFDLLFFNANPTASTVADQSAFALNAADFTKLIGAVQIASSDYFAVNAGLSVAAKNGIGLVLQPVSGTSIYCVAVTQSAPDYVAATDLAFQFGILQD